LSIAVTRPAYGVILDWTTCAFPAATLTALPSSTARISTNTPIHAKESASRLGHISSTIIGRNGSSKLISSPTPLFWLDKYHIDGLRVDAVASMLYLDYSRKPTSGFPINSAVARIFTLSISSSAMNEVAHGKFPGVLTIAEESTSWPAVSRPIYLGGLGFQLQMETWAG